MVVVSDKKDGEVTFVLQGVPGAKEAYLAGEFNRWNPTANRMMKYRDGTFRTKLTLRPGKYQYKFVVDGSWITDASIRDQVPNPFGSTNSLAKIG